MNEPRTEAGREAMHAVDMIGEAFNIDIGYKDWRNRILAIEREAAAPQPLDVGVLVDFATQVASLCNDPYLVREAELILRLSRNEPSGTIRAPADSWRDTGNRGAAEHAARPSRKEPSDE